MIIVAALLILIYFVPGFFSSLLFEGRQKKSPLVWLFLSLLIVPIFYTLLITLKVLNLESFILLNTIYAALCLGAGKKVTPNQKVNLDKLGLPTKTSGILVILSVIFFTLVMAPRLGLLRGHFPIGDDFRQIPKVVAIAASPDEPLFPYFPITRLTIYYFANIAPGLLVRFSNNLIKADEAWFIQTAVYTTIMLWLITKIGQALFESKISHFTFFFSMTFLSGLEYYLYLLKNPGDLDQLEWWTDWFLPQSKIHLQTTNPYNLFFWVPQHLFAAILVLLIFLVLRSDEKDKLLTRIFLGVIWANILGSSAFVFLSTAAVYAIYTIVELIQKRTVRKTLEFNLPIATIAIALSIKNLELFLTAEKGRHFVQMANVFRFLPNYTLWGKLVNFSLTTPLYYLIELGVLLPVLLWALYQFVKNQNFRQKYLLLYLFIFLWPLIFVVKTTGDNNIALRTFIPAQIALALFAAELTERYQKRRLFYPLLIAGIIISLPSGIWDFGRHFEGQLTFLQKGKQSIYQNIDKKLPLNSIIFTYTNEAENLVVLGHRFTFKPVAQFTSTNKEYSAFSKIEPYANMGFSQKRDIIKITEEHPQILKMFNLYVLEKKPVRPRLLHSPKP